jgi:DNA repair ATPase RecN
MSGVVDFFKVAASVSSINERLDRMEPRIDERLHSVETRMDERLRSVETRMDGWDEKLTTVHERVIMQGAELSEIREIINTKIENAVLRAMNNLGGGAHPPPRLPEP